MWAESKAFECVIKTFFAADSTETVGMRVEQVARNCPFFGSYLEHKEGKEMNIRFPDRDCAQRCNRSEEMPLPAYCMLCTCEN